jgi:hypothetical protein
MLEGQKQFEETEHSIRTSLMQSMNVIIIRLGMLKKYV